VAVRPILKYPNANLRRAALPVEAFDDALKTLADDLLETMRTVQGLGITGPHIGVLQRVTVIQLEPEAPVKIYVNPRVVWASDEIQSYKEGSISMPDVLEDIERPARVRVQYQDLAGDEHTEEADGLLSVCLQHEIDQLDGIYWIDSLSRLKRDKVIRRYEKMKRLSAG
jgi:peptide deformylase